MELFLSESFEEWYLPVLRADQVHKNHYYHDKIILMASMRKPKASFQSVRKCYFTQYSRPPDPRGHVPSPPWVPEAAAAPNHIDAAFFLPRKGSGSRLPLGPSERPASPLVCFGAVTQRHRDRRAGNRGGCSVTDGRACPRRDSWRHWTRGGSRPGREGRHSVSFRHPTQNDTQLKTYELLISGIFHLVILDHSLTAGN